MASTEDTIGPRPSGFAISRPQNRDDRIDLLRGIALICMFFDHIPGNILSIITIGNFGFCDAAEIFVFLAGYSATIAYRHVLERDGLTAFLSKIAHRCVSIYIVQCALFLVTTVIIMLRMHVYDAGETGLPPIIDDGFVSILRGLLMQALPAYLDILPLYFLFLAAFPLILICLQKSKISTVVFSILIYYIINIFHFNLQNYIGREIVSTWTFNPFAWQLIYVLGAAFAFDGQSRKGLLTTPSTFLRILCGLYILFALLFGRWGVLWFGNAIGDFPASFFGNGPKSFVSPWRIFDVLGIAYLALTSTSLTTIARHSALRPVLACGRHSLGIFASTCIISLIGRIIFRDVGHAVTIQAGVNAVGLATMFWIASRLDRYKTQRTEAPRTADLVLSRKLN